MKQKINFLSVLFVFMLLVNACNENDEININESKQQKSYKLYRRDFFIEEEDAIVIASSFINEKLGNTRSSEIQLTSCIKYDNKKTNTKGSLLEEPFLYIVNFERPNSFVIVSSDVRSTQIYAYSVNGNLYLSKEDKGGVSYFLDSALDYLQDEVYGLSQIERPPFIPKDSTPPVVPGPNDPASIVVIEIDGVRYRYQSNIEMSSQVLPIVTTAWHQAAPYNYFCPFNSNSELTNSKEYLGCAVVAVGQIVKAFSYVSSNYPLSFLWNIMRDQYGLHEEDYSSLEVARFLYRIGHELNAPYSQDSDPETPVLTSNVPGALSRLGYSHSSLCSFNSNLVTSSLDDGYLVYARGENNETMQGHAWVIDGYQQYVDHYTLYYDYPPYDVYERATKRLGTYYHCNWGSDEPGQNGYFLDTFSRPSATYNHDNQIVYNIHPNY